MKIAIAVPGRWSAFELAMALKARGHEISLLTTYPKWLAVRFGVDPKIVKSAWAYWILGRIGQWVGASANELAIERFYSKGYGRWAAKMLASERWDAVLLYSQFAEEALSALRGRDTLMFVNKENSHVREQAEVLEQEEIRTGIHVTRPSKWAIEREEREYRSADAIRVVAQYSRQTFLKRGVPDAKVWVNPSGTPIEAFRPDAGVVAERARRIRAGEPLRVVFVGAKVLRKGLWDLIPIVEALHGERFRFRVVGPSAPESRALLKQLTGKAELVPKQRQWNLPEQYKWADLYLFPSLEEGFPQTTAQAWASGLPILTTPNGGGTEFVQEGGNGWIMPARSPMAFIERLRWCDREREALAAIVESSVQEKEPRTWAKVAEEFEQELSRRS